MKRFTVWLLVMLFTLSAAGCACAETTGDGYPELVLEVDDAQEPTEVSEGALAGVSIGIDPGHQAHGNFDFEAIAPGSSETKYKVSSGTDSVTTGKPEYEVVLEIGLQLREALQAQGCTVYMTREINEVDISNQERAKMMNEYGVDLVLRLHCDGAESEGPHGITLYVNETGPIAQASYDAADVLIEAMTQATGAKNRGVRQSDTYTGLNWSEVPCILVEMGFMSNPEEDVKLQSPDYQALLVEGMVEGIIRWSQTLPKE